MRMRKWSEITKRIRTLDKKRLKPRSKRTKMYEIEKTTMQLWIYRVKKLTRFKKRCMINTPTKRYIQHSCVYTIAVTLAMRSHLFSYRTQKLSSSAPTILDWRRSGKIGRCCIQKENHTFRVVFLFLDQHDHIPPAITTWLVREEVDSFKQGNVVATPYLHCIVI